jgi:hypothetical protein
MSSNLLGDQMRHAEDLQILQQSTICKVSGDSYSAKYHTWNHEIKSRQAKVKQSMI